VAQSLLSSSTRHRIHWAVTSIELILAPFETID
jgi:hypothetical protein